MMKRYQKPMVSTLEIPERTAYACNLAGAGCPHVSNLVGHAICGPSPSAITLGGGPKLGDCS